MVAPSHAYLKSQSSYNRGKNRELVPLNSF